MSGEGATGQSSEESLKSIPPPSHETLINWEAFREWFWTNSNGNDLIKYLNDAGKTDYIRRESFDNRPEIHCIELNGVKFPAKTGKVQWTLCKVGFTRCNTRGEANDRMKQVMDQIKKKYADRDATPRVLFKLTIGAVDTTPYYRTEKRIREAMGWPIKKELAKKMGLACSTEWVLTTQDFIDEVMIKVLKESKGIDLFKDTKFKNKKYTPPTWILDETDANGQVTCVTDFQKSRV